VLSRVLASGYDVWPPCRWPRLAGHAPLPGGTAHSGARPSAAWGAEGPLGTRPWHLPGGC